MQPATSRMNASGSWSSSLSLLALLEGPSPGDAFVVVSLLPAFASAVKRPKNELLSAVVLLVLHRWIPADRVVNPANESGDLGLVRNHAP